MVGFKKRQAGLTGLSIMMLLVLIGFIAMFLIRLAPVYIENFSVNSSLNSLKSDPETKGSTESQLRDRLMKRFDVNDVNRVKSDDVTIDRDGTRYTIDVAYDVQVPFLYNIDFLVHFDDTAEIETR